MPKKHSTNLSPNCDVTANHRPRGQDSQQYFWAREDALPVRRRTRVKSGTSSQQNHGIALRSPYLACAYLTPCFVGCVDGDAKLVVSTISITIGTGISVATACCAMIGIHVRQCVMCQPAMVSMRRRANHSEDMWLSLISGAMVVFDFRC